MTVSRVRVEGSHQTPREPLCALGRHQMFWRYRRHGDLGGDVHHGRSTGWPPTGSAAVASFGGAARATHRVAISDWQRIKMVPGHANPTPTAANHRALTFATPA